MLVKFQNSFIFIYDSSVLFQELSETLPSGISMPPDPTSTIQTHASWASLGYFIFVGILLFDWKFFRDSLTRVHEDCSLVSSRARPRLFFGWHSLWKITVRILIFLVLSLRRPSHPVDIVISPSSFFGDPVDRVGLMNSQRCGDHMLATAPVDSHEYSFSPTGV